MFRGVQPAAIYTRLLSTHWLNTEDPERGQRYCRGGYSKSGCTGGLGTWATHTGERAEDGLGQTCRIMQHTHAV